jgi:acetolactate synthase small subunit
MSDLKNGQRAATIAVLVENEAGVLARVIGLFSGRGYNIDSLTVAPVDETGRVVDATTESFVLEMTGNGDKIDAFVALMRPIGLAEVSRTGAVAIARGPKGIME